jgi:hypothetical protein
MEQLPKLARIFRVDWAAGRVSHDTKKAVQMGSGLAGRNRAGARMPKHVDDGRKLHALR